MSIPILTQVYDELRRLAIAGSAVAPGDFRLKKLIEPLRQAGVKAPVFAKVADAACRLVESNEKTAAAALLELTTLTNAVLYTQGETGIGGEMQPVKTRDLGLAKTQASARVLKPLLEALSTTGSGRMEVIREAHERGAFRDLRLIVPSLGALDDTYGEIADFIAEKVLPLYGPAILPELHSKFDPKGRSGHVRRLRLMHQLDPDGTHELVKQALDEGSKEVRIVAIECLGQSPDDLPFLLEQVRAKAKDVRSAALKALGNSQADSAVKILCGAIESNDLELAIEPIRESRSPVIADFLLEAAEKQAGELLGKEKDKKKLGKMNERMMLILECLIGRDDKKTEKLLLNLFARMEQLAKVGGEPSGKDVVERLVSVMSQGPTKVQSALIDAHETLPSIQLGDAFIAACRSRKPAEVFKLFSPYLRAKVDEKKKNRDPAYQKRQVILDVVTQRPIWQYYDDDDESKSDEFDLVATLDPQWLDLAVELEQIDIVLNLAAPGHAKANKLLSTLFKQRSAKNSDEYLLQRVLETMIRVRHPEATDAMMEYIKKRAKSKDHYGYYWMGHLIAGLPKEAVPKLEALLPTLPEKMIDELHEFVTQLKNSP